MRVGGRKEVHRKGKGRIFPCFSPLQKIFLSSLSLLPFLQSVSPSSLLSLLSLSSLLSHQIAAELQAIREVEIGRVGKTGVERCLTLCSRGTAQGKVDHALIVGKGTDICVFLGSLSRERERGVGGERERERERE